MTTTDILIGAVDLYNWEQMRPWVKSIKRSGFTGEIWLIAYRVDESDLKIVESHGINVYKVDHDPFLRPIQHAQPGTPTQAHNLRFFHAWELLARLDSDNYRYAIMTDVRDVIFQKNPSIWLEQRGVGPQQFIAPSEGIRFKDEEWNQNNLKMGHGPIVYDQGYGDLKAYNVGTIAGGADIMRRLSYMIYTMTCGRHYPSDQSSFNVIVNDLLRFNALEVGMDEGWAAQLGTTHDPTKPWLWDRICDPRPLLYDDVSVRTTAGELFTIVHQWDRVPNLKAAYTKAIFHQ